MAWRQIFKLLQIGWITKGLILTLDHMGTPLKNQNLKNWASSCFNLAQILSWPKVGLGPKCHDTGTFGGFGKRGQINRQTRFMFFKYRYDPKVMNIQLEKRNPETFFYPLTMRNETTYGAKHTYTPTRFSIP